ncbi:MAG: RidA family protein [Flavobacteriales bacterium]|nr:RidA family protein [Flavobacteriales bacterium]
MKTIIETKNAPAPIGPYNQAVLANGTLYMSGQIAMNPESGELILDNIEAETEQVMKNMEGVLLKAGMTLDNVVKCSIYITDMNNFSRINEVYGKFFTTDFPARETVEVVRLPMDVNVEMSATAVKDFGSDAVKG